MNYKRGDLVYEGKAKKIFTVEGNQDLIWQEFKDSLTAFNAEKKAEMKGKGEINRQIASVIFKKLSANQIPSHWIADVDETHMVTKKLEMIPLEVVVRNVLAGSTAKKFAIPEGTPLAKPLVEFYYKKDELADPFISDDQAMMLKTVRSENDLQTLKTLALKVNSVIQQLFGRAGIRLIDFKLEFGYDSSGAILLADEISPDSCRLWDEKTGEKMDKDRFRRDLGNVLEYYQMVLDRITK